MYTLLLTSSALVVGVIALVFSIMFGRIILAFLRYQLGKRHYTAIPKMSFRSWYIPPILEYFSPIGLERPLNAVPRDAEGNYVPLFNEGPHLNGQQMIGVTDPELLKVILTNVNDFVKPAVGYDSAKILLGEGLVTSEGSRWKNQRRLVTPIFHFERLKAMPAVVTQHMDRFISEIKGLIQSDPKYNLPATHVIRQVTMKIIISLAFGDDFDPQFMADSWEKLNQAFKLYALGKLLFGSVFDYFPIAASSEPQRLKKEMMAVVAQVVEKRRARMAKEGVENQPEDSDLLTAMLRVRDPESGGAVIPLEELLDQSLTFLFAGHDTTSSLLSWTMYFLSLHPETQRQLQAEVDSVVGTARVDNEHMEKLVLCRHVLQEVLRLQPVVTFLNREVTRDLELGGQKLPKGTIVNTNFYCVQHNPKYWSRPEEFIPERWASQETKGAHPFAWIPFSAGPRNCVGKNFAMREATIILAMLMREFSVEQVINGPQDHVHMESEVTVEPKNLKIRFRPRQ